MCNSNTAALSTKGCILYRLNRRPHFREYFEASELPASNAAAFRDDFSLDWLVRWPACDYMIMILSLNLLKT